MEKYPIYLIKDPQPLIGVIGTVENDATIHERIISTFQSIYEDTESSSNSTENTFPSFVYRSLPNDYHFKEKKATNEFPSFDGILKSNWLEKHSQNIPSVVVMLSSFNIETNQSDWNRKEFTIIERYSKIKAVVSPRDTKMIFINIKIGNNVIDKDVIEDRISSLKKHLQIDSKSFYQISLNEITNQSSVLRKIAKILREYSALYYFSQCKHIRSLEKSMSSNRTQLDMILTARYNYKLGYFNEFQGNKQNSLKYYRICYNSLVDAIEVLDEEWTDQIEAIAEFCNYKICYILFTLTLYRDSLIQFRYHISKFLKAYSSPWRHFAWLSDQYIVYAQLLDNFKITESSPDTERSFYYLNAAKYSMKRQTAFENTLDFTNRSNSISVNNFNSNVLQYPVSIENFTNQSNYRGMKLVSPKYVGSLPQLYDPIIDQIQPWNDEIEGIVRKFYEEQEKSIDHSKIIMNLLLLAYKRIDSIALTSSTLLSNYVSKSNIPNLPMTNIWITRRHLYIESLIAEQYLKQQQYYFSFKLLVNTSNVLCYEGWISVAIPLLYHRLDCCTHLGLLEEYLNTALLLYSKASVQFLDKYKKEQLHRDIFSVLNAASSNSPAHSPKSLNGDRNSWQTPYIPVPLRSEYGSNSHLIDDLSSNHVPLTILPNNYIVYLTSINTLPATLGSGISISNQSTAQAVALKPKPYSDISTHNSINSKDNELKSLVSPLSIPITNFSSIYQNSSVWYHKLFNVTVKFHDLNIEIGRSVLVTISMVSLFHGLITFHEMIFYFYGNSIKQKFKHNELSGVGDCNGGVILTDLHDGLSDNITANLVFKPNQEAIFTFPILVTEEVVSKLQLHNQILHQNNVKSNHIIVLESIICLEKIDLILINKINTTVNTSTEDETNNQQDDLLDSEESLHRVTLTISTLPEGISRLDPPVYTPSSLLNSSSSILNQSSALHISNKPLSVKEIVLLYNLSRESLCYINRPPSLVSMVYPITPTADLPTISLLQGPLQRVNVIFHTNENDFIDGRIYISSDYITIIDNDDYLFWYPDKTDNHEGDTLDSVKFYPLNVMSSLSSAILQPISYIKLPDYQPKQLFSLTLFLRSESINSFKIKLRLEYIPKRNLKNAISKDFEFKISFLRPLQVNFSLLSHREAQSGVVRDATLSTIVKNDVITVSTALTCLDSLDKNIIIKTLDIRTNSNENIEDKILDNNNYFNIKGINNDQFSLLVPNDVTDSTLVNEIVTDNSNGVSIKRGESYVSSADLICRDDHTAPIPNILISNQNNTNNSIKTSIGNIYMDWCIDDNNIISNINIINYLISKGINQFDELNAIKSKDDKVFDWLPNLYINMDKIDDNEEIFYETLNKEVSITRLCSMIFSIPSVNVVNAPFNLKIVSPSVVYLTQVFEVAVVVNNLLWTFERFILKTDLLDSYIVAGGTSITYDISPQGKAIITLFIIPLKCGQIPLPHISLIWERNNTPIVEVGSSLSPKFVYVQPIGININ